MINCYLCQILDSKDLVTFVYILMILNVNKMRFQYQIKKYLALMFYFGHTEVKYLNPLDTNGRNVIFVQNKIIQRESKRTIQRNCQQQDEEKQNKNTTQYVLDTTIHKQTQTT